MSNKSKEDKAESTTSCSGHVKPVVSCEFEITKKQALSKVQETFDKSVNKGDLVGASVTITHIRAISSANYC